MTPNPDDAATIATTSDGGPGSGRTDASSPGHPTGDAMSPSSKDGAVLTRGPTPPTAGSKFPFPQNRQSSSCAYPTAYNNDDVKAAYAQWKNDTVTSSGANGFLRVQRTPSDLTLSPGSTVSEGIGYGMLLAVYMNDQQLFDGLWKYEQSHLGSCPPQPGVCPAMELMDWYISADGTMALGTGGATDADEDMAFALVMADKQWGGQGSLAKSYRQYALDQIAAVWVLEVFQSMFLKPGTWGDSSTLNPSYFAPAYYRVFKQYGGNLPNGDSGMSWNPNWDAIIDSSYAVIDASLNAANGNQNDGLVPAWCTNGGAPNGAAIMGGNATNYQYDSCRTPFRIALDWCWNAEPRAQAYLAKTSGFFSGIGVANIVDGYALNGTPQPQNPGKQSAAFIGPATVGAMSSASYQPFVNDGYAAVATGKLLAGGAYYEESWTTLSLLMMTANFLNYSAL
ncbi:MAG TPA: glycosyl hydrolase family 8 [Polyangiaceae bacterium]|nr:glycosyl hydrolase family 8 [Polyangiaceae bacterium]